tara:strand:- start:2529 stop:4754 length:2226 start_codon:yes stop_codon:yes gene_type:complete
MASYNQKDFKESNVSYTNKDFSNLKDSLMNYAKSYFPDSYKDFNETSPGMMLLEMSAYVGDVLNFYIDQQYREMMLPLAEERRNILNIAKMMGYKVKPIVPAYVDLTFTSEVNASSTDSSLVDYTDGGVFPADIVVTSNINSDLIFKTLEPIDFTISGSGETDTLSPRTQNASGLTATYTLSRTVRAMSAETKTKTFTVGTPQKFFKITLPETNVVDIVSCVDANGNTWYEVDYLAQDKVPIPTHYTSEIRTNAYYNLDGNEFTSGVAVPYSLQYIKTSKRFIRETNEDNTTSLVFGNGILKNGTTDNSGFLDLEQAGIIIPGQAGDLASAIDPLLGDEYSTLGETPIQTTLTITYRIGGGIDSNAASGDLNEFTAPVTLLANNSSTDASLLSVTNNIPARGGKDEESIEEIREKTKAFFTTQNRCVTKEDYEARVLNIPPKHGNIAKVYVSRELPETINTTYNLQGVKDSLTAITVSFEDIIANSVQDPATGDITINDTLLDALIADIDAANTNLPSGDVLFQATAGEITIHILAYDQNKNLVGNPVADMIGTADNIPEILKNNISNYIDNYRILTDTIEIQDGFIINFGVFFDVVVHKFANKQQVKLLCIEKIKDYFKIDKMQFSSPIYISQLEYELMGIDGVRAVNHVTITQEEDYNADDADDVAPLASPTYKYSITAVGEFPFDDVTEIDETGTEGYGWLYNFEAYEENGIIIPPSPSTPGVFELKNPNQNIRGVVR